MPAVVFAVAVVTALAWTLALGSFGHDVAVDLRLALGRTGCESSWRCWLIAWCLLQIPTLGVFRARGFPAPALARVPSASCFYQGTPYADGF